MKMKVTRGTPRGRLSLSQKDARELYRSLDEYTDVLADKYPNLWDAPDVVREKYDFCLDLMGVLEGLTLEDEA